MAGAAELRSAGHDGRSEGTRQRKSEGGLLNMLRCQEIRKEAEPQRADLDGLAVENARTIENLLRRAHEIHRQHGGILSYDLEDWLQAEGELAEEHRATFRRGDAVPIEVELSH